MGRLNGSHRGRVSSRQEVLAGSQAEAMGIRAQWTLGWTASETSETSENLSNS